jgi:hypothetical protein
MIKNLPMEWLAIGSAGVLILAANIFMFLG